MCNFFKQFHQAKSIKEVDVHRCQKVRTKNLTLLLISVQKENGPFEQNDQNDLPQYFHHSLPVYHSVQPYSDSIPVQHLRHPKFSQHTGAFEE